MKKICSTFRVKRKVDQLVYKVDLSERVAEFDQQKYKMAQLTDDIKEGD